LLPVVPRRTVGNDAETEMGHSIISECGLGPFALIYPHITSALIYVLRADGVRVGWADPTLVGN
jgi:hypothetical protein